MKLKSILLTAIFFSFLFPWMEISTEAPNIPVKEFTIEEGLLPEDSASFPELKTWAIYQFYELEPDGADLGIQDYICRMIPETGLRFLLEKNPKNSSTVFLYLDLTRYVPRKEARFKSRKLEIKVNGRMKTEVYISKNRNFKNPVEISLEPFEFPDGKIYVELTPSKNESGRFWGIWDAFILENRLR
ncbi:hypothetical protein EHS15_17645 [Leptospira idonii]|uniref:Lipoprotein n=1 Tax=Leptospira idonii TaxID=1193500 RepID=A0A4V3JXM5_9LEPT|nr:hypothetical protein EHS15_17645 [Leptospira idonii]